MPAARTASSRCAAPLHMPLLCAAASLHQTEATHPQRQLLRQRAVSGLQSQLQDHHNRLAVSLLSCKLWA
jgi:hypothetical protein